MKRAAKGKENKRMADYYAEQNFVRHGGMSRRDYFAGKALAGLCADPNVHMTADSAPKHAEACYLMADAMIAAAKAPEPKPAQVEGFCLSEMTLRTLARQFPLDAISTGVVADGHTVAQLVHDAMKARGVR